MMDRLTERFSNGQAASYWCGSNCKYDHKYCCENLENCPAMEDILEKLAHYEDLEEAGRLIELPCKIGDAVYGIRRYHSERKVQYGVVSEMYFSQKNRLIIVIKHIGRGYWGESIFGSFEEAEAALKERETE